MRERHTACSCFVGVRLNRMMHVSRLTVRKRQRLLRTFSRNFFFPLSGSELEASQVGNF